MAEKMG